MKKGNELGLTPIKCSHKEGNECIKDLHYQLNDLLYKWSRKYISSKVANRLIGRLEQIGKKLAKLDISDKCKPKRDEILKETRTIYKTLRRYYETYQPSVEDKEQALQTAKYQLSMYLKRKDELTEKDVVSMLEENREIYDLVLRENDCTYKPFFKMQEELIEMIVSKYRIIE